MPRFEIREGSSNKFWEISLEGATFTTTWGRIGTNGQTKTQQFDSEETAKKEHDKLVREKENKGYERVGASASTKGASNPELEAAILKAPDDEAAYLVYGDWLQGQGDPRGEFIALQHARSQAIGSAATTHKRQVAAFLKKHQAQMLGGELTRASLAEELVVDWHLGFIRAARLGKADAESRLDVPSAVRALLTHPSARFLRGLSIGLVDLEGNNTYDGVTRAIVDAGASQSLQRLFIGDFNYPSQYEISWSYLKDVSPLYAVLPDLRSLRLRGTAVELADIHLPELREFIMESGGLPLGAVKSIANARWPKLERLDVWFGSARYGAEGGVEDIRSILDGKGLPKVTQLGLCNSEFTDELVKVLPTAKILAQLTHLDLSKGILSDEGAQVLARNASAFGHLKSLDLRQNLLTHDGVKLLATLCPNVALGYQRNPDADSRYCSVGE
ncbi:WGR domain-containing protein [Myxococcus landrumensis]|uniref:WGR domain-containing protein n=1 Tax=Myxococcus landrumensis TaxID=2813577 RepID=A0ABX7NGL1_9BACT|nr:WGR domain-containing protein [Myxococcus landrumus]QSQ17586.1 WGR domain-containing protein [Myxococcus landrumus]